MSRPSTDPVERFIDKFLVMPDGCWSWQQCRTKYGYGKFTSSTGNSVYAHRYAYEWLVGPIPEGLALDHLCRNTRCVNPAHLEPVTLSENMKRGDHTNKGIRNREKTHCAQGHPFDAGNTRWTKEGWRGCRACNRINSRNQRAKCH